MKPSMSKADQRGGEPARMLASRGPVSEEASQLVYLAIWRLASREACQPGRRPVYMPASSEAWQLVGKQAGRLASR